MFAQSRKMKGRNSSDPYTLNLLLSFVRVGGRPKPKIPRPGAKSTAAEFPTQLTLKISRTLDFLRIVERGNRPIAAKAPRFAAKHYCILRLLSFQSNSMRRMLTLPLFNCAEFSRCFFQNFNDPNDQHQYLLAFDG